MSIIKDGTGTKNQAKVDTKNRLHVKSTKTDAFDDAVIDGDGFLSITSVLTLTSANASGLLYFKNNGEETLFIEKSILYIGNTNGTGDFQYNTFANPGACSTIITSATTGAVTFNLNLASNTSLTSDTFDGFEGATVIGTALPIILDKPGVYEFKSGLVLPKGQSISNTLTPPPGNTSCKVVFHSFVYKLRDV